MLLFVRHAPVTKGGLCYGRADVPTTPLEASDPKVHRLVRDLRGRLAGRDAKLFTSPARRCVEVASYLVRTVAGLDPLPPDERLWELSMGEWDGLPWTEVEARDAPRLHTWMRCWQTTAPPGGETPSQLAQRVAAFLAEQSGGSLWVVVAHAGVIRASWVIAEGVTWEQALRRPVPHLQLLEHQVDR